MLDALKAGTHPLGLEAAVGFVFFAFVCVFELFFKKKPIHTIYVPLTLFRSHD